MAATVPFDMLAEIQGWAPAGGFVRSEWRNGVALEPGDLMRLNGAWAVITARGEAVTKDGRGEVVDRSPAIAWRSEGDDGTRILWSSEGAEVRTDTRIDPGTIPAS
jgi:hypothetical protein